MYIYIYLALKRCLRICVSFGSSEMALKSGKVVTLI